MATCANLSDKQCAPCHSLNESALVPKEQIIEELKNLPLWSSSEQGKKISRKFTAKNFQAALECINLIGAVAEREGHHPDLHLTSYRDVEIVLFTHKVGGVTFNDFALARAIDLEVKVMYSPKWLRENPEADSTALK